MNTTNTSRGFTLIELMVVVAIVGLLATIAIPAYNDHIRKTNRVDAITALTQLQLAQEKLRANCRFYGDQIAAASDCGADADNTDLAYTTGAANSPEGHYTIAITDGSASGNGYTATATAVSASQLEDTDCRTFTLTVSAASPQGTKTSADSGGGATTICW